MIYTSAQKLLDQYGGGDMAAISSSSVKSAELIKEVNSAGSGGVGAAAALGTINAAITSAEKRIDESLYGRYTLPLAAGDISGSSLPEIAQKLVRYSLDKNPTDKVKDEHVDALKQLRQLADGHLTLSIKDAPVVTSGAKTKARAASQFNWGGY